MGRKPRLIEVGQRFNRLKMVKDLGTVRVSENNTTIRIALFVCDCGNEKQLAVHNVVGGKTKSCGCMLNSKNGAFSNRERKLKSSLRVKDGFFDVDDFIKSDFILQG